MTAERGSGQRATRVGRKIVAAGALVGAVVLGGCSQSPSDVAVVDGTAISREQLDRGLTVGQEVAKLGNGQPLSNDQVLSVMIQGEVAAQVAQQKNIRITAADRDKMIDPAILGAISDRELIYDDIDRRIVVQKLGEQQFIKELTAADVTVNPRYGSWDAKKAVAVIPGVGSLSQPAENRPQ